MKALSAPLRVRIIAALGAEPRCVNDLVDTLGASQSLVSQHLRVLRAAGVVRGSRRGKEIYYALTDERIADIVAAALSYVDHD